MGTELHKREQKDKKIRFDKELNVSVVKFNLLNSPFYYLFDNLINNY